MANYREIQRQYENTNLDRRISWYRNTTKIGQETPSFADPVKIWAKRVEYTEDLLFDTVLLRPAGEILYLTRYRTPLFSTFDYIIDETLRYNISEVKELDRRRWILLKTILQS